ncbi:hypothetical protein PTT_14128 [Pyrenophora teres f. teres 0-1]|uniref:Uncharacterized protein n=1 Tax=Pyrenophora teres f. teres (strain 0-1) TaxID=861557 RepID=E3RXJ9_PYRTT|nr:hypothetical protein PTT_14128 [Pyrenophora teres f. teres 0-1]
MTRQLLESDPTIVASYPYSRNSPNPKTSLPHRSLKLLLHITSIYGPKIMNENLDVGLIAEAISKSRHLITAPQKAGGKDNDFVRKDYKSPKDSDTSKIVNPEHHNDLKANADPYCKCLAQEEIGFAIVLWMILEEKDKKKFSGWW